MRLGGSAALLSRRCEPDLPTTDRLEQAFSIQAGLTPDAPAIFHCGEVVSYGALDALAEHFAGDLRRHGVAPGVIVALSLERTPALVAMLFATLRAGGAFLPLDPHYPPQRTQFVLSDSRASLLIFDGDTAPPDHFAGTILEVTKGGLRQVARGSASRVTAPVQLAYVIYTSGTTGRPKGVMLGHDARYLVDWARLAYSESERSRVAATTSLCFDPAIFEIFVPLSTGGAIILKDNILEPFAADEQPTILDCVPSVLKELCRTGTIPKSVQVLNAGGELLAGELVRQLFSERPRLAIQNHYGPTEATTCATIAKVPRDLVGDPSIGRPVRGAEVLLFDEHGEVVEEGRTGEIHIGGPGLALGYLGLPALTNERFLQRAHGRLYRTGDLGCWEGGELYFRGRRDRQVKVRGFRIELDEVEAALSRIEKVDRAFVTVRSSNPSQVVGYVESAHPLTSSAVRQVLARWLPAYMVPSRIVVLPSMPLLVSGKVDQSALPDPNEPPLADASEVSRWERPIIHVFEEVLGRGSVGPGDSFFDLGGDSLSSVRTALRLEEVLGLNVPAALIHQAPTPRALALSLQHGQVAADRHLSLLQPGGAGTPLFCMADLFGQAFNYLSLARRVAEDRPVYGVVPGPLQEQFTNSGDIAGLTRAFVAELRQTQPHGPYLIAGHSAGGVFAVDVACALEREGEEVGLILLDAFLYASRPSSRRVARFFWEQASGIVAPRRGVVGARPGKTSLFIKLLRRLSPGQPPNWMPRSQMAFAARLMKASVSYRALSFCGRALIVKAMQRDPIDELFDEDGRLGWSAPLGGDIDQVCVQGSHYTFMREPHVASTADAVRSFCRLLVGADDRAPVSAATVSDSWRSKKAGRNGSIARTA